jgi:DNA-binding transcriptional regulator YiaG
MADICRNCEREYDVRMASWEEPYSYTESGLPYIRLINIPVYRCADCSVESADVPNIDELHKLIAKDIILTPLPISGIELRFLRKEAYLKPQEIAERLGVEPRTITNWEKAPKLSRQSDLLIRLTIVSELWAGNERTEVLKQLADLVKYEWEPESDAPVPEPEQGIADLIADNVAYGLDQNHQWGIAA